jgi:hypothetical protein
MPVASKQRERERFQCRKPVANDLKPSVEFLNCLHNVRLSKINATSKVLLETSMPKTSVPSLINSSSKIVLWVNLANTDSKLVFDTVRPDRNFIETESGLIYLQTQKVLSCFPDSSFLTTNKRP